MGGAAKSKAAKVRGTSRPAHKVIPQVFSSWGDYSTSVQGSGKDPAKLRAETKSEKYILAE